MSEYDSDESCDSQCSDDGGYDGRNDVVVADVQGSRLSYPPLPSSSHDALDVNYIRYQLGLTPLPPNHPSSSIQMGLTITTGVQTNATANGNANGNANPNPKPNELLEYVRLDYIRNADGNWVTKRTEEPIAPKEDEFSGYSFSVQRNWDYRGVSVSSYSCLA